MCRSAIKLELSPSVALRDMVSVLMIGTERMTKIEEDMGFYKRHIQCIRLGAHCTGKMCLRPKIQNNNNPEQ